MKKSYIKYISSVLLFGLNGIVASKIALSSYEIVLLRTLIGSIFLLVVFFLSKNKLTFTQHKKECAFICISGIAMGASWMFLYEAYSKLGVGMGSLVYYCGPIIIMILSPFLFKERLTFNKITGFLSVLLGIFLVNGKMLADGNNSWGFFCGIMSAVTYAIMIIFNKRSKNITGFENSLLQLIISFITTAVFVGIKQGIIFNISCSDIAPILVLGIINTGVGCYLYFSSIGDLPVQTVSICGYLEPLSAVIFSDLLLNEIMLPVQIVGAVFILGGAVFSELKFRC